MYGRVSKYMGIKCLNCEYILIAVYIGKRTEGNDFYMIMICPKCGGAYKVDCSVNVKELFSGVKR